MADRERFDDDSDDGLGAFDFSIPASPADDDSGLDSFGGFDSPDDSAEGDEGQETLFPLFVVTNPPGTVSITAAISGQLQHVQLPPQASRMTESELGRDILRTAAVAIKKAQAGLNYFVYSTLVKQGMDHSSARNSRSSACRCRASNRPRKPRPSSSPSICGSEFSLPRAIPVRRRRR